MILEVDRDRDGRSFSARHVNAVQEGEVIFSMVTSFHAESEEADGDGVFDDAPRREVPAPDATPRGGWNPLLEVREVTPDGLPEGRLHRLRVGAFAHARCPTTRWCIEPGSTYLSDIGTGFGQKPPALVGSRRAVHRPLHVVPRAHPRRRLGPGRPAAREGPQRAGLLPGLAARPGRPVGGDAVSRAPAACPGRCPSWSRASCARRPRWRPRRGGSRVTSRSCSGRTGSIRPGADPESDWSASVATSFCAYEDQPGCPRAVYEHIPAHFATI